MATSGKSINLWWEKGSKPSSYLTGLLGFSSEDEERGKSEKPQTKLMVGPIAVVSSVFSQIAAIFIPRIVQLFMMVLHALLCSGFFPTCLQFRFADSWDIVLIIVGTVMAIINGATVPISFIVFGQLIDVFILNSRTSYVNISDYSQSSVPVRCEDVPKVRILFPVLTAGCVFSDFRSHLSHKQHLTRRNAWVRQKLSSK